MSEMHMTLVCIESFRLCIVDLIIAQMRSGNLSAFLAGSLVSSKTF